MKENAKKALAALNVTALILGGSLPAMAGDKPQAAATQKTEIIQPANKTITAKSALQDSGNKEVFKERIPKAREKVGAGFCGAGKCGGGDKSADVPLPVPAKK